MESTDRDLLNWTDISTKTRQILAYYKVAIKTILKNRWLFAIPLFSILLNYAKSLLFVYRYDPEILQAASYASFRDGYFSFFSVKDHLFMTFVLRPFDWLMVTIIDPLSLTGLIGGGVALIGAIMFIRPLYRAFRHRMDIMIPAIVSILGLCATWILVQYHSIDFALLHAIQILSALFSIFLSALGLSVFLTYLKRIMQKTDNPGNRAILIADAVQAFPIIFTTLVIITLTNVNIFFATYNTSYVRFAIAILHTIIVIVAVYVPLIAIVRNKKEAFLETVKSSLLMFKRFPKQTAIFISINLLVTVILMLAKDFITYPLLGSFYGLRLQQSVYEGLHLANTLIMAVVLMKFVIERNEAPQVTLQ